MSPPFLLCPRCGVPGGEWRKEHEYACPACGFRFFQNVAAACGVLLQHHGQVLFLVRAKEPRRGFWGLPGGFVDAGESVEEALVREVAEEIGATIGRARYQTSFANQYPFAGVVYHTCDLYFTAELKCEPSTLRADPAEVSELLWLDPSQVDPERLAFPSLRSFWQTIRPSLPSGPDSR